MALASTNRPFSSKIQRLKTTMRFATSNNESEQKVAKDDQTASIPKPNQEFKPLTWNPLRLMVLKLGFTEPAWTSSLNYGKRDGIYSCAYCGLELFDSDGYYESGSGWPSFFRSVEDGHVKYKKEWDGRLECQCGRCSSHLGHVFLDGPRPEKVSKAIFESSPASDPRGRQATYLPRFCVNGASLKFDKRGEEEKN